MRPDESDRPIIRDIMNKGVRCPDSENFTENIMARLRYETSGQPEKAPGFFNPPAILMMVFLIVLSIVPFMNWLLGMVNGETEIAFMAVLQEIIGQINGYLLYSPLFLLIFIVSFILYKLDRFLEKRSALE